MTISFTSMCDGAERHHSTASAMSEGCRHFIELTTARAASSSPKERTVKNSVSTSPGEMPDTLSGSPLERACGQSSSKQYALGNVQRDAWKGCVMHPC